MQEQREELERLNEQLKAQILSRTAQLGSNPTAIPGFSLIRRQQANELRIFYRPFIGLTVQGFKRTLVGNNEFSYGRLHCVVAGIDMPGESYITAASDAEPFLALSLDLDRSLVARLAAEMPPGARPESAPGKSVAVMEANAKVMIAFLRLIELLDAPEEIPVMAPMLIREIHYRMLMGPQGDWLRTICSLGTASNRVAQAVSFLRENYRAPLNVDKLAQRVGMSSSSFYRNFKQMTSFSPLQFQKTLRLYEAQRLLLTGGHDVTQAAYAVGYESSTQFIREYRRLFGEPPRRDVQRKRAAVL